MRNIYMGIWRTDKLVSDKLVSDKLVSDKLVTDKLVSDKLVTDKLVPDKLTRDNTIKGLLSIIDSIIILEERVKLCNSDIEELTICNANLVKRYNESEVKHKIAEDKLLMIIEELYDKMK